MRTPQRARATSVRLIWILMLAITLASLHAPVVGQAGSNAAPLQFRDDAEQRRFNTLSAELRCVMCQNQSLADSEAQIAQDLRAEVLKLIQQGRSDAEIKHFLVQRYGEFVLYRPRVAINTWLLWFGPLLLVVAGGVLIARIVRSRTRAMLTGSTKREKTFEEQQTDEQEW